jgi:protein tyrosine phosphatase (PTP) superfamily phosphohydrolase (DUF442 family)
MTTLEAIYNYRRLSPRLATAGQPLEEELHAIGRAGFDVVINLGLADAPYAVADEQAILESHGLRYLHIPVSFEAPEARCFESFREHMRTLAQHRLFVHCAANKRVSVFVALYRVIEEGRRLDEVWSDVEAIWQPDAAWQAFIRDTLRTAGRSG